VGVRFPFWFAPSELVASPSSLCQAAPGYQLRPSPPVARARPCRHRLPATPRCPAPRLECRRAVTTPPSFPLPLIPLLNPPPPIFNGVKATIAGVNPGHPSRCFPDPYKRVSTTPGAFHPSPSFSHLLSRARTPPPTEFPDHHRATATPGRHTAVRAPVSRPPNSPRLTPPLPPLGRRPWTPERSEAEAPVSPVPPSMAGPPWSGVPVVHGPVHLVYENFFTKIIH
jgi:hypothetical protein